MKFPRASGVLLHPTSLPGRYGIGDLGRHAYEFVDFLKMTGQTLWQVLPLGPTSYGDSPYQATSTFAGNPLLISLDTLKEAGWLTDEDLPPSGDFDDYMVNYGPVIEYHFDALNQAFTRFSETASPEARDQFANFCDTNTDWLTEYALFAALKDSHDGAPWWDWPLGQALRDPEELEAARQGLDDTIQSHMFRQWLFFDQWTKLRAYANEAGIRLMGDIPIFVAHDSADTWANQQYFYLDERGNTTVIAGVPPDYFSATGQRWGNPLYRWNVMKADDYDWWKARYRMSMRLCDLVRIDHFRGFEAYWEVPAAEETAVNGEWKKGPSADFFVALQSEFGEELPIVAEDLGEITPEVYALRDRFGFPGMKILQFAFDDSCNPNSFQPHTYRNPNCVVYTGTHDNNTTLGWWHSVSDGVRNCVQAYMGTIHDPARDLMRLGMMSVADTVIIPLQDILGYGGDTRMNFPGRAAGNWAWRFHQSALTEEIRFILGDMTYRYDRRPLTEEQIAKRKAGNVHGSV
jgi:4-alpha-glucanotransferase